MEETLTLLRAARSGDREAAGRISESFRRCPGAAGAADKILSVCENPLP